MLLFKEIAGQARNDSDSNGIVFTQNWSDIMSIDITKKPLPIGQSCFDRVIEDGSYYVDKTLFIKDILDRKAAVILCTRPRRFGKTLNQTMLKCFFEDTTRIGGKDTRALFNGLKIEETGERYMEYQGKYPVIFLSFKDTGNETLDLTCKAFKDIISEEFRRHSYLREKIGNAVDLKKFETISSGEGDISLYDSSLKFLSKCLEDYHGKRAVILIDEYDVPLQKSWLFGFFDKLIDFIRSLLSSALKDNPHLHLSVMTGCLRISKESMFTGLNHLEVISILNNYYSEYFGFTQNEIDAMLDYYGLTEKKDTVRDWYNGYLFGNTEVYNPWSSLHVVNSWIKDINDLPKPYWVNTSDNAVIREMIDKMNADAKDSLGTLMAGGTISAAVHEGVTYSEIYNDADNLWNFLFFTGYLKKVGESVDRIERIILEMKIPNKELNIIYEEKIQEWFNETIHQKDFKPLYEALLCGDAARVQEELGDFLLETISYMDGKEDFYHGVVLGVLAGMRNFTAKSNRETGTGRCDIILRHASGRGKAVILELKYTPDMREIEKKCEEAVRQIETGQYAKELETECYTDIVKYGLSFCKKSCEVRKG
ncbi:hypothetical protein R80B4_03039 [Fibrobacteres bacterium R8-0-B4]